ncbi:hypothetical protein J6590_029103 [Homalodisca vitripennis]|nr:hypothetical protein J6590_029103 [Homalodisca vitripennis]
MTVNSGGEFSSKSDGFIPIDHVTDGMTGRKKRLLNPLMIRLKREKMFQLYDLQLVQAVNAEAKEEVINYENSPNFTGCDTTSSHPTCGFSFFNNKIIQFSEGFCCSCDQTKNDQRQPCDSHSLDIKSLPEQSRYAHPHRNRSSRGLEAIEPGLELSASNSNFEEEEDENDENSLSLASQSQPFLKGVVAEEGNFAFESHLESGVLENSNDVFINDQSLLDERTDNDGPISGVISNLSVKRFQFDYSIAPMDLCSTEISEPGLSLGNEDEFQFTTSSEGGGNNFTNFLADINSTLSKEKLKLLMMNKIKLEKYEEKMESTTLCTFPENNEKYNQIRSLTSKQEGAKNITKVFPKSSPREFSLKLINRDSELNIELVTKRANNFNISSKESLLSTANYDTKTTEKSTNNSFVKFVKLLKSRPPLSQNISSIKHLKQGNKVNADNETNGIKSIENIVHKLIPIISPPFMSSEVVNYSTLQLELKNAEQITQNVTYEDQQRPTTDGFQTATIQYLRNSNNKSTSKKRLQQSLTKQNSSLDDSVQKHLSELNEPGLEIDRTRLHLEGHQSKIIEKRDVCVNDRQIRGGQSCSPVAQLPCNADPVTYYESAHCLRFSDLWYNVFPEVAVSSDQGNHLLNSIPAQPHQPSGEAGARISKQSFAECLSLVTLPPQADTIDFGLKYGAVPTQTAAKGSSRGLTKHSISSSTLNKRAIHVADKALSYCWDVILRFPLISGVEVNREWLIEYELRSHSVGDHFENSAWVYSFSDGAMAHVRRAIPPQASNHQPIS